MTVSPGVTVTIGTLHTLGCPRAILTRYLSRKLPSSARLHRSPFLVSVAVFLKVSDVVILDSTNLFFGLGLTAFLAVFHPGGRRAASCTDARSSTAPCRLCHPTARYKWQPIYLLYLKAWTISCQHAN